MIAFFSQQSKENLDIVASVINCMNAFATGKLEPPKFSMDDLDQIHPEDVEEMDITWQMAMAAFRAKNFMRKIGGETSGNPQVNRNQTPTQPSPPNTKRAIVTTTNSTTAASGSTQSSALVVQPEATFDWNSEIQRLNISAPKNQTTLDNIDFMTSAPEDQTSAPKDQNSSPEDHTSIDNLAFMTQIL
ncbi:hypothetical protein Hanom_Chr04g00329161 [Helianthus anomalus]